MAALSGVGDGWGVRRVSRSLLDASSKSEGDLVRCGDDGEKLETDDDDDDNIHSFGGDSDNDDDDEGKEGGSMGTASVQHKGTAMVPNWMVALPRQLPTFVGYE